MVNNNVATAILQKCGFSMFIGIEQRNCADITIYKYNKKNTKFS